MDGDAADRTEKSMGFLVSYAVLCRVCTEYGQLSMRTNSPLLATSLVSKQLSVGRQQDPRQLDIARLSPPPCAIFVSFRPSAVFQIAPGPVKNGRQKGLKRPINEPSLCLCDGAILPFLEPREAHDVPSRWCVSVCQLFTAAIRGDCLFALSVLCPLSSVCDDAFLPLCSLSTKVAAESRHLWHAAVVAFCEQG